MRLLYVLRYFFREAILNLWTNRFNNFVSIAIISFSLFTLGLFLITAQNLAELIGHWTENVKISIFLNDNSSDNHVAQLEAMIKASPFVSKYQYITREEALNRFRNFYPSMKDLADDLQNNPFPASFEITIRREFQNQNAVHDFVKQIRTQDAVQDVEYDQEWIDRVQFMIRFIEFVGLVFGGILIFTATFSISNVIKLMVLSRRDEIEIMRLVGATNSFIKGPFLTEGLLHGFIGGALATGLLFVLYIFLVQRISQLNAPFFAANQIQFLSGWMIAAVISGGMIVGFFGSLFSVTRLMRI
ncbi:permease-like cell division protein FtsX [bacterium]|nr:permease-like cell division protein FtsX [bacterium]MCI0616210.1 permease-like cell division protein FtsX [bacterium]